MTTKSPQTEAPDLELGRTYPGTPELVATIISESKNHPAWRPARAGALMALAEEQPRIWMTQQQFIDWLDVNSWVSRRRKEGVTPIQAIGMSPRTKLKLIRGERPVSKVEALACAHYHARFDVPTPPGDVNAFAIWVNDTFGAARRIGEWLDLTNTIITDRMRGFDIDLGRRRVRAPEIDLIRAMDFVARCGPFVPYGIREPVEYFPKAEA
jgi:hypothetical protein